MAKNDQYHPDYKKLYPGIELRPEILTVLKRSDRKMEYIDVDLKTERFIYRPKAKIAVFLPSREDSYDRMLGEHQQFAHTETTPEETLLHSVELECLRKALERLADDERRLIHLRYWRGFTQKETALKMGLTQQAVSYRERRILQKLRKMIEK